MLGFEPSGGVRAFEIDAVFLRDCKGLVSSTIFGVGAAPGMMSFGRFEGSAGAGGVISPVLNSGE
jgi:hypothetical protein